MKCLVVNCENNDRQPRHDGISFHKLPSNADQKKKWLIAINREDMQVVDCDVICSAHFIEADFINPFKRIRLKKSALPRILDAYVDVTEKLADISNIADNIEKMPATSMELDDGVVEQVSNPNTSDLMNSFFQDWDDVLENVDVESCADSILTSDVPITLDQFPESSTPTHRQTPTFSSGNKIFTHKKMTLKRAMYSSEEENILLTPKKARLKDKVTILKNKVTLKNKKMKIMSQKVIRQNNRITKLNELLDNLKTKNLIDDENHSHLSNLSASHNEMLKRMILKKQGKPVPKEYQEDLRMFALNLNFYSPKAYTFVRQHFDGCLPHSRTLRNWYKRVNCDPGFTSESFHCIKNAVTEAEKIGQKLYINVVFDDMAIRSQVEWNGTDSCGYVDIGDGGSDSNNIATNVFVIMAVCVNRAWKIPLGYFPIIALKGDQKKNILSLCLQNIIETKAIPIGVTFDGQSSNISAMKILGCDIFNTHLEEYVFKINGSDAEVAVNPDPCHMLKLIRNSFGDLKVIVNGDGKKIEWKYLDHLLEIQNREGLHLGNKLRKTHIYFHQNKMKVKYAVQTLSKSVADAIDFCRGILKLPEFENSEATTEFLRMFNDIFDILNSRTIRGHGFKKALCKANIKESTVFIDVATDYIQNLRTLNDVRLINHGKRTGFVGFIVCLKNIKVLYKKYIADEALYYIPYYKLNQDHIELFFGTVRSSLGHNNNPTVRQFKAAYKRILIHAKIREGGVGNCTLLEDVPILKYQPIDSVQEINNTIERPAMVDTNNNTASQHEWSDDNDDNDLYLNQINFNEYTKHVVEYIAGFVVFKLKSKLNCPECICALEGDVNKRSLISYKSFGYLQYPSKCVILICELTEKEIRHQQNLVKSAGTTILNNKHFKKIVIRVQNALITSNLFPGLDEHMLGNNHYSLLIKSTIEKYLNTRYFFLAKSTVNSKVPIRNMHTKIVLFKGQ